MGYELTERTAGKLKALINAGMSTGTPSNGGGGTPRYDTHVRITGPESSGLYPCVPCHWNQDDGVWEEFEEAWTKASNDGDLEEDRRYRALCYGSVDDLLVFVADEGVGAGCYLEYDDDDNLTLNLDELVGDGLEVDDDSSSGTCDPIKVKAGCGILVDGNGVSVDLEAIAVDGLYGDNELCTIGVNVECGLQYIGTSGIGVDVASLAGTGLVLEEGDDSSSGECDKLAIDTEIVDTVVIEVAGAPVLTGGGCSIGIETPITTYEFGLNAAGVVVSITDLGTVTTSNSVDTNCPPDLSPCVTYDCVDGECERVCDDTGAYATLSECEAAITYDCVSGGCVAACGGSGEYATLSECEEACEEDCAGWYCCEETGACVYLEDCAAVDAYVCDDESSSDESSSGDESSGECTPCGTAPAQVQVTASGISNSFCSNCTIYNGTHTLDLTEGSPCVWYVNLGELGCGAGAVISVAWDSFFSRWQISFGGVAAYIKTTWDCASGATFDFDTSTGACSTWPATITLSVI